jgi:hypothetical protein
MIIIIGKDGSLLTREVRAQGYDGTIIGYGWNQSENRDNCLYCEQPGDLALAVYNNDPSDCRVLVTTANTIPMPDVQGLVDLVTRAAHSKISSQNVVSKFAADWAENFILNLPWSSKRPCASSLNLSGIPVIIVGPGPSLDRNKGLLEFAKGRCALMFLTRATLLVEDVEPDFVIAIDHQAIGIQARPTKAVGILDYCIDQSAEERFERSFMIGGHGNYDGMLNGIIGSDVCIIPSGSTVAFSAVALASQCGAKDIAFVGMDLSYDAKGRYVGSGYIPDGEILSHSARGYYGGTVQCSPDLYRTLFAIERFAASHPCNFYNCTEGGAFIEGFDHIPLSTFLEENRAEVDIGGRINQCYADGLRNRSMHYQKHLYATLANVAKEL